MLGLLAAPAVAEAPPQLILAGREDEALAQPAPEPPPMLPPVMYLAPRPQADFVEERRQLLEALGRATAHGAAPGDPEVARVLLDFAEFYYAHAMAVEGLAMLSALEEAQLAPAHASRLAALQLALGLLDLRDRPLEPAAAALLTDAFARWDDQPLFLALERIRAGAPAEAAPYLAAAAERLPRFPPAVRAAVLPGLLDAAIQSEQWRIARDLAAQFKDHAELRDSPAYAYLLGRAAETGGDLLAALDSYARAGAGGDLWAHRARVGLVAMGLSNGILEPGEARVLLEQARQLWSGDAEARGVLRDLAVLQAAEGDRVAAVETLGALITRYPESEEAAAARPKALDLIATIYDEGASGQLPLAEFLVAHRRIAPDFRFDPGFAEPAERFADRFRAAGATKIAADEYAAVHDYLAVIRDLGVAAIPPERLDGLALKQAEALIAGGRGEDAAAVLRAGLQSADPALQDRLNTLSASLYADTGALQQVVETQVYTPSESYLRIKAGAYFSLGDWAAAERAYDQLFAVYGPDLAFADAANLLLAAYRNGRLERVVQLAESFPDLTERPEWAEIAASLAQEAPDLLPLRRDTARRRVDSAGQTLERLDPASLKSN